MWWWRRMEKISLTDHVRNEEELLPVYEQGYILHDIRKRKSNWIGHILRRNCLIKQVIEGKIKGEMKVTRRQGRRRKKLLDDLKDKRGYSHLKEENLDRTVWRNRFGGSYGTVVRQNTEWMNMAVSVFIHKFIRISYIETVTCTQSVFDVVRYNQLKLKSFIYERDVNIFFFLHDEEKEPEWALWRNKRRIKKRH
jgi:hypothetical protein